MPPLNPSLSPRQMVIAGVFAILVIAGVVGASLASLKLETIQGPTSMVEDSNHRVWIRTGRNTLWKLDSQGRVLARLEGDRLGIQPTLGALAALPDGKVLVGDNGKGTVHVLSEEGANLEVLDPAKPGAGIDRPEGAFHLAFDPAREEILLADSKRHRILAFNRQGALVRSGGSPDGRPGLFRFPNQVTFEASGHPWVVDTNHHRLVRLDEGLGEAESIPVTLGSLVYPVYAASDGNAGFYVSVKNNSLEGGRVAHFNARGEPGKVLELAPDADPYSILVRSEDILVADAAHFEIRTFTLGGAKLGRFGAANFQAALAQAWWDKVFYRTLVWVIRLGMALAFLGVLAGYIWEQMLTQSGSPSPSRAHVAISPLRSSLLSALVPGLGQFFQERLGVAVTWMLVWGGLLILSIAPAFVLMNRNMDFNIRFVVNQLALLLVVWVGNMVDAYRGGNRSQT